MLHFLIVIFEKCDCTKELDLVWLCSLSTFAHVFSFITGKKKSMTKNGNLQCTTALYLNVCFIICTSGPFFTNKINY